MGLITGTHHTALRCSDNEQFAAAIRFYCDTLGLEIVRQWGEGANAGIMFNTGNSLIEIFASGRTSDSAGTVNHYALATDDVDACVEAVRRAGYKIKLEPSDIVIPSEIPFPARIAFVYGPVGEEIEFFCEK